MADQDAETDPEKTESPWAAFRLFRGRSATTHVVFLSVVLAVWCLVAFTLFESGLITTSPAAAGEGAEANRRLVGGLTGFFVGALLGVATLRSLGGPFLNVVLSGLMSVIGPLVLFPVAYGTLPALYGPASDRFDLVSLVATGPGVVGFFLASAVYARFVWTDADHDRWLDSLPENPVITPVDRDS